MCVASNLQCAFLSTLSLRRATAHDAKGPGRVFDFYPRSPCGERRHLPLSQCRLGPISIHALLAESDTGDCVMRIFTDDISIHALLAESDCNRLHPSPADSHFYPRSPCGERRYWPCVPLVGCAISIHALLAESDTVRPAFTVRGASFLSTLSLRRATDDILAGVNELLISIHALLAESDLKPPVQTHGQKHFYPRSPCGERPIQTLILPMGRLFLSTLSLRRATRPIA